MKPRCSSISNKEKAMKWITRIAILGYLVLPLSMGIIAGGCSDVVEHKYRDGKRVSIGDRVAWYNNDANWEGVATGTLRTQPWVVVVYIPKNGDPMYPDEVRTDVYNCANLRLRARKGMPMNPAVIVKKDEPDEPKTEPDIPALITSKVRHAVLHAKAEESEKLSERIALDLQTKEINDMLVRMRAQMDKIEKEKEKPQQRQTNRAWE
jgi:hypothetical protein